MLRLVEARQRDAQHARVDEHGAAQPRLSSRKPLFDNPNFSSFSRTSSVMNGRPSGREVVATPPLLMLIDERQHGLLELLPDRRHVGII